MSYRLRGLGETLNYYDLLRQAGLENCDVYDSQCVANNVAKQVAVEDFWIQHMATGVESGTQPDFSNITGNRAAFMQNIPQTPTYYVPAPVALPAAPAPVSIPAPVPKPAAPVPLPSQSVPTASAPNPAPVGGQVVMQASAVPGEAPSSGFELPSAVSGLPWYVWAIGAAGLLYAFGGHRGR